MRLLTIIFLLGLLFGQNTAVAEVSSNDSLLLLLSKTDSRKEKIRNLNHLATDVMATDVGAALLYTRELERLIEDCTDEEAKEYYGVVALLYLGCNVYDYAYEAFLRSLKIAEKLDDQRMICVLKSNIGGVYLKLFKYEEALRYFTNGLQTAEKLAASGDEYLRTNLCAFYNNVGLTYGKTGKPNIAITYLEKAIEITPDSMPHNLARYYYNIAPVYHEVGEKAKAFDCVRRAETYWQQVGNNTMLAHCNQVLASFRFREKDYGRATALLDSALLYANNKGSKVLYRDIYELYVKVCGALGNYQQANKYLEDLYQVKEALINDDVVGKVTSLKLEYDFDKKQAEQELAQQKARYRHYLLYAVAGILILALLLAYLAIRFRMHRIRAEKKSLEDDLEQRNKELTTNVMYLIKNADTMKEVVLRLNQLTHNMKPENARAVKVVINDLQALSRNDIWDEFEVRFNRVHIDFYKKLQKKFPTLTPTEMKVCAFLRLNMSSKEISSLTGITSKSVDVMRARIRKKLDIAHTDLNLITFLAEI